jgi:hypothetical protein
MTDAPRTRQSDPVNAVTPVPMSPNVTKCLTLSHFGRSLRAILYFRLPSSLRTPRSPSFDSPHTSNRVTRPL